MLIPKQFYLRDKLWRVKYSHLPDADGLTTQATRLIEINRLTPRTEKPDTMMHEFLHACLYELHLSGPSDVLSKEVEEILCTGLSQLLLETFEIKWRDSVIKPRKEPLP